MKLLHVIRSLDPRDGGIVSLLRHLVQAGQRRGDGAVVATLDGASAPWLVSWPGAVEALGPGCGTYGYARRLVPWLRVHAGFYDAVVLHGLWQYTTFGSWRALNGLRSPVPHAVVPHGMLDAWVRDGVPLTYCKKALYWPLEHLVCRSAAAVCFTAQEEMERSCDTFRPYSCRNVVIGAGIEPPPSHNAAQQVEAFLSAFPQLRGRRYAIYFGRLDLKKGCDLLARAFGEVAGNDPALSLVFAGPDSTGLEPHLRALMPEPVQARVHFTGMLDGDAKWGALRAAEVFIIPSHQENFCLAAAEALACGTPALLSDKVNIWREVVGDGAGFMRPDTLEGTRALLRGWMESTPAAREAMCLQARPCFAKHFSIDRMYENLVHVFNAA